LKCSQRDWQSHMQLWVDLPVEYNISTTDIRFIRFIVRPYVCALHRGCYCEIILNWITFLWSLGDLIIVEFIGVSVFFVACRYICFSSQHIHSGNRVWKLRSKNLIIKLCSHLIYFSLCTHVSYFYLFYLQFDYYRYI
jgi:hypothetical protein